MTTRETQNLHCGLVASLKSLSWAVKYRISVKDSISFAAKHSEAWDSPCFGDHPEEQGHGDSLDTAPTREL